MEFSGFWISRPVPPYSMSSHKETSSQNSRHGKEWYEGNCQDRPGGVLKCGNYPHLYISRAWKFLQHLSWDLRDEHGVCVNTTWASSHCYIRTSQLDSEKTICSKKCWKWTSKIIATGMIFKIVSSSTVTSIFLCSKWPSIRFHLSGDHLWSYLCFMQ